MCWNAVRNCVDWHRFVFGCIVVCVAGLTDVWRAKCICGELVEIEANSELSTANLPFECCLCGAK